MTVAPDDQIERLVKSVDRIRDLGEVFTPVATVNAMLNLIPDGMWQPHPSATFFEPSCGDGNFLAAVLMRKLANVADRWKAGDLPAGSTREAAQFHALQALASIYAVDLSADNIIGGTPGHETGARDRLLALFKDWHYETLAERLDRRSAVLNSARWIVERNVQVGNMLSVNADGTPSRREDLPLIEYNWEPTTLSVAVSQTTLGVTMTAGAAETTGVMSLFDTSDLSVAWTGRAVDLDQAPLPPPATVEVPARNGKGWR